MFSATYDEEVTDKIDALIEEANQMALKVERLKLESVRQFEYRCEPKKKIDFLMQAFEEAANT